MKTYRIEEELTSGWHEIHTNLTKDEAKSKLDEMIAEADPDRKFELQTVKEQWIER